MNKPELRYFYYQEFDLHWRVEYIYTRGAPATRLDPPDPPEFEITEVKVAEDETLPYVDVTDLVMGNESLWQGLHDAIAEHHAETGD